MKKTYEKPAFVRKGKLSAVTAGNGASGPVINGNAPA
ncbi:lasso RiPP family leader peptide-containing protein [Mesorhizobium sp.]|nr:lasso RiPP family leader peptide-containing protein [Mesorhizobium sp.]RWM24568.1 MAG: lasso RiPP family leader peptide-containing protein [Mesorhizobium sp.]RWM37994.1 MAG: lasso RiPP family leader peptide-containing protein [Mesorhizobium sp.]TIO72258.1 MAG: lasso RiPP family leader peptide-containing protein [Mesorhizobium sp.]TIO82885.1 MAG: lasso RiPP family leader peptide-containing protein [Mesorhizobium sp.]TJV49527.1 MAG: lasso RiPP family leader peptide-containing protein [Mesorhi